MTDFRSPTRDAIIARLKASFSVTALIPRASIYAATVPAGRTFPFSRLGGMIETPFRATCLDSSTFRVTVQGFTRDVTDAGGGVLLPAEDNADRIGAAFKDALDGRTIPLSAGGLIYRARPTWLQTNTMIDGAEDGAWMATATFNVEISA